MIKKNIKKKEILKLGCFLYNLKMQILLIDCDKLLFLKKYKNIEDLMKIIIADKRIFYLIYKLLKHRVYHICWL